MGARALRLDDNLGKYFQIDVSSPLSANYELHFPSTPPLYTKNYLVIDASGNINWTNNTLPPLSPGSLWYGNLSSIATELPAGMQGSVLTMGASNIPVWTTTLPNIVNVSANQLTSGTLQPGTTITVGPGSSIVPVGGTVNANLLSGSGLGKYSGKIDIATGTNYLDISYTGIMAFSSVTVSVFDPQAMIFGFVDAKVSQINPGVGFRVIFSADYPNSGTGELHYTVVNP